MLTARTSSEQVEVAQALASQISSVSEEDFPALGTVPVAAHVVLL